eukprot:PhF_6_TR5195/c0_g1_i1/m.7476
MDNDGSVYVFDKPFTFFNIELPATVHIPLLCFFPPLLYVILLKGIFPLFTPTTPNGVFRMCKIRKWHNIAMTLFSLAIFVGTVLESLPELLTVFTSSDALWTFDRYRLFLCSESTPTMIGLNWIFIISKVFPECLDTAFIVWLKNEYAHSILDKKDPKKEKQGSKHQHHETGVSFVHGFHHATTMYAFLIVTNASFGPKLGCLLNGGVHTLMYAHYSGIPIIPKKFIWILTVGQMAQFLVVISAWITASNQQYGCTKFSRWAHHHQLEWYSAFLFVPVYLVFFLRFFVKRFVLPLLKKKH